MPAAVESMMYVRERPWHGLGVEVQEAVTSEEALKLAGLNWEVEQHPIQVCGGSKIENYRANIRSTDGKVLGVVSNRYKIVQNTDAFSFTDELIGGDVYYETAGSLKEGKKIWLLARMPEVKIIDDAIEPFLCFSNTHDGTGAIRVCMTPIRVVCNNTLNLALKNAKRQWSTRHIGNLEVKMEEARMCLDLADDYMGELAAYADRLANTAVSNEKINEILDELFPVSEDDSLRKKTSVKRLKDEYMVCYFRPDIAQFIDTAWGAVNAMSDMITHSAPLRQTETYRENNWGKIMDGHIMLDKMVDLIGVK